VIIGVGIDVVDVARFGRSLVRTPGLARRVFTPAERALSVASMAARFAAKEALAKALGAPVAAPADPPVGAQPALQPATHVTNPMSTICLTLSISPCTMGNGPTIETAKRLARRFPHR